MIATYAFFFLTVLGSGTGVHGSVRDAHNGEPLSRVTVRIVELDRRTETDANGAFDFGEMEPGDYTLSLSTVGYRLIEKRFQIKPGKAVNLDLALSPDAFSHTDVVQVQADPFELAGGNSGPTGFTIPGSEVKNLASVLVDDPLRAVQTAPGVSSDDDFDGRFSLHGAPYDRIGLYLDGILLHAPFHTVQGEGPSGSMAVFNGDMVQTMTIESEAYPARFEDRTAGVLEVQTREGSRTQTHLRASISMPDAGLLVEGPLGRKHKGSWLVSARKSYLQYLLDRIPAYSGSAMAFGFTDFQGQANYDLNRNNSVSLQLIDGTSDLNRSSAKSQLGLNASMLAHYHFTLANAGWLYAPNASLVVNTHVAFMRERYDDKNLNLAALGNGFYGEWAGKSDATWEWSHAGKLQFGASSRQVRGEGFANYYFDVVTYTPTEQHRGNALLVGGYVQQSWTGFSKHLYLSAGTRWDHLNVNGSSIISPQASIAFMPWSSTKLTLSWGRYAQFPDINDLYAENGSTHLLPIRSDHYAVALEQRLGLLTRFRIQAYERNDSNLLFQPFLEARISDGQIIPDNYLAPIENSLSGRAKGVEFFLQRRTANGWTGWVSYNLGYTEMQDGIAGIRFPSDQDQRHTANAYVGYRIRPSVNLSAKWIYGSGFPIPGFFEERDGIYYLSTERNGARLPSYQRLDLRINKSHAFERWKMTLYAEVVNVLNHANYRFDSYNGFNSSTGQAYISLAKMFPVLPSAGVVFEF